MAEEREIDPLDEILKDVPTFRTRRRGPRTVEERDDPATLHNIRTIADIQRAVADIQRAVTRLTSDTGRTMSARIKK